MSNNAGLKILDAIGIDHSKVMVEKISFDLQACCNHAVVTIVTFVSGNSMNEINRILSEDVEYSICDKESKEKPLSDRFMSYLQTGK